MAGENLTGPLGFSDLNTPLKGQSQNIFKACFPPTSCNDELGKIAFRGNGQTQTSTCTASIFSRIRCFVLLHTKFEKWAVERLRMSTWWTLCTCERKPQCFHVWRTDLPCIREQENLPACVENLPVLRTFLWQNLRVREPKNLPLREPSRAQNLSVSEFQENVSVLRGREPPYGNLLVLKRTFL